MSRVSSTKRKIQIKQRRLRHNKLKKLREAYLKAGGEVGKERILEKAVGVAPWLSKEAFLAPIEKKMKD